MEKIFNKTNAFIIVSLLIVMKLFLFAGLELHPDEGYYWLWSQNLALGYYDHSPMVAYFIKLTTIFSDSELFVRFSTIIVTVVLSCLVWKFSKSFFGEAVAAGSVIVLNTFPLMMIGSLVITPDTPVFLFYSLTVYFFWQLIETNKTKYWYITGLFFGLALLSKYTAILFGLCLLVYMILDKRFNWFKNKHFYLMFVVAFIVFLPVIIWNYQHDWISFSFQLKHGLKSSKLYFNYVLEYFGAQCLVAGPFVFIAGLIASIPYFKSKDSKKIFLVSFSIPIILFFAFTALKRYPGANWPAFAYLAFAIMTAQYLLSGKTKIKRRILIIGIAFNMVISMLVGLHAKFSIVPIYKFSQKAAIADATNWFGGWKMLGDDLLARNVKYAIARSQQYGGIIAYYTRQGQVQTFLNSERKNQYAYWDVPDDLKTSKTAIVLIDNSMDDDFSLIEGAEILVVKKNGLAIRQYAIIEVNGYDLNTNEVL